MVKRSKKIYLNRKLTDKVQNKKNIKLNCIDINANFERDRYGNRI